MCPSLRQLALRCLVWAVVAWYTVAVWAITANSTGGVTAFAHYYAVRAPFVGALMGLVWSPVFALGYHPKRLRGGHDAGRDPFAEDTGWRHWMRFLRGAVIGQLVGASTSFLLLYFWPMEMQRTWNDATKWAAVTDAVKWAAVFWGLYWYLFVPAAGVAGVVSVWMALRHREIPSFRSVGAMHRLRDRHEEEES